MVVEHKLKSGQGTTSLQQGSTGSKSELRIDAYPAPSAFESAFMEQIDPGGVRGHIPTSAAYTLAERAKNLPVTLFLPAPSHKATPS